MNTPMPFPRADDFYNLSKPILIEHAIKNNEGILSDTGALITNTGNYTGRSPNDKFTVVDQQTTDTIWFNDGNKKISLENAEQLKEKIVQHLSKKPVYITDAIAGASKQHAIKIRLVAERAWHALFAHNMFLDLGKDDGKKPIDFTIFHAPTFLAIPNKDHTNSEVAIVINYEKKYVLICGTEYAGEIKKSIFTVLNYLLPQKGILGMHCSANKSKAGKVAIFFGLSGTGKTTLSADSTRDLIGDDEHGWDEDGVFNFEGGCYAKVINLSPEDEPEISSAIKQFTSILENVGFNASSRQVDLADDSRTENTRASYDLSFIPHACLEKKGEHPEHIIMLTCDAFGVLPPIAKLSPALATYHFINGYTAKVAGTERGIKEPKAVFSACFGAPFMAHYPAVYAKLLAEKIQKHQVKCWLVNTGWTGGPYGHGSRMKIAWTRTLLRAALDGQLDQAEYYQDDRFKLLVPTEVPGIPREIFTPKKTWGDPKAYEEQAAKLAQLFHNNFEAYRALLPDEIRNAAPRLK